MRKASTDTNNKFQLYLVEIKLLYSIFALRAVNLKFFLEIICMGISKRSPRMDVQSKCLKFDFGMKCNINIY